jgi:hypothetical protein
MHCLSSGPGLLEHCAFAPIHMWAAHVMPTGGTHMNVNAKLGALGVLRSLPSVLCSIASISQDL